MTRERLFRVAAAGLGTVAVAALALAAGPPRLLLLNDGIRLEYAWWRAAAALLCSLCAAAIAVGGRGWLRGGGVVVALTAAGLGIGRLRFRVEAAQDGLSARGLLGTTAIAWGEVRQVRNEGDELVVQGAGAEIRIGTAGISGEQRASLERTIARRVGAAGK